MASPSVAASIEPAPTASIVAPLRLPNYRFLLSSGALSWAARWIETVVLAWLVLQLTDSAWNVALLGFSRTAAMPLLGVLGGAIADRYDRRKLLFATQGLNLAVIAGLAGLLALGQLNLWLIYAGTILLGVAWTVDMPTRRALVVDLVGAPLIHRSIMLDTGTMVLTRVIGPIIGGALFTPLGPLGCFILMAGIYLAAIGLLLRIEVKTMPVRRPFREIGENLASGVRYAVTNEVILAILISTLVMNLLAFSYMNMTPVVARDSLGVGPEELGLLSAADGLGMLIGVIALSQLKDRRHGLVYLAGAFCFGVFLVLFALSPWFWVSFALLLLAGFSLAGFGTNQSTIILLSVPPEMRGRSMGILTTAIGTLPFGALLIGALASGVGAPQAIVLSAGLNTILIGAIALKSGALRKY